MFTLGRCDLRHVIVWWLIFYVSTWLGHTEPLSLNGHFWMCLQVFLKRTVSELVDGVTKQPPLMWYRHHQSTESPDRIKGQSALSAAWWAFSCYLPLLRSSHSDNAFLGLHRSHHGPHNYHNHSNQFLKTDFFNSIGLILWRALTLSQFICPIILQSSLIISDILWARNWDSKVTQLKVTYQVHTEC